METVERKGWRWGIWSLWGTYEIMECRCSNSLAFPVCWRCLVERMSSTGAVHHVVESDNLGIK